MIEFSGHGAVTIGGVENVADTGTGRGWVEPVGRPGGLVGRHRRRGPEQLAAELSARRGHEVRTDRRPHGPLTCASVPGQELERRMW